MTARSSAALKLLAQLQVVQDQPVAVVGKVRLFVVSLQVAVAKLELTQAASRVPV